jgi:membrane-associated HD superfamily phosphohydrolase
MLKTLAMSYTVSVDQATIQQWIAAKLEPKAVEEELVLMGMDEVAIASNLQVFKRLRNAKRQVNGFICMGLGAFTGFISCILTVLNPIPELYNVILFGLTSVAIVIVFLGMYFLFE